MISISSLVDMCVAKGYITQDQAPWLYYGIEKRLTTILISIPMLIIGSLVSSPTMAMAFYISFYLRRWTKGYTIKQPNMDCQPTEITALMRHRAVFS